MKVRKRYLWDVDVAPGEEQTESFRRFYVERILQGGTMEDIRDIGLPEIRRLLPDLNLPRVIRDFWESYFRRHPEIVLAGEDPHARPGSAPR